MKLYSLYKSKRPKDTETVARELIGCTLLYKGEQGVIGGTIVETEAYLGLSDKACHSYGGKKTKRVETMYQDAGHAYVYLIYGMHHCLNVVTGDCDTPEAVLIRALDPTHSVDIMKQNRQKTRLQDLASGPGKLCQAMELTRDHDGLLFNSSPFQILSPARKVPSSKIMATPRIGIDYAEEAVSWPLRFYHTDSFCVSKRR